MTANICGDHIWRALAVTVLVSVFCVWKLEFLASDVQLDIVVFSFPLPVLWLPGSPNKSGELCMSDMFVDTGAY